ncbi:hypothetical protein [Singulisphaera acidiphila]|uniref:Carboxypeptidase regulatory-like domain-containing protein n=1 Tax=Singulisphaera acidiphila (strain ATCC BAA-1392 / DSM 18658 / VKM B-2454 / MOB10) TaxID=886293 RepID=L0DAN8_SINAD|nr:hypothetical protein [Singulisphaera acidiphila]AGA25741.1 hypothetical protein Sinac_1356 [Singulisphaera acidiphila DSM 18658]
MFFNRIQSLTGRSRFSRRPLWLVCACLSTLAGCGSSDGAAGKVTVYPVKGKVLLADGQPLTSGRVVFMPLGELMIESSGPIGSDGTFSLSTGVSGEGAPAGDFRVKIEPDDSNLAVAKPGTKSMAKRKLPFPPQYADEETSGLKITIKPEPNDLPPIRLQKTAPRSVASVRVSD